jgi:hypothetical protein
MRFVTLFGFLVATACTGSEGESDGGDAGRAKSFLSVDERNRSDLSSRWLVGYWDHEQNCGSRSGTSLWPDGRYTMNDGYGRWSLSGSTITISEERPPSMQFMQVRLGDPGTATLVRKGPNEILVKAPGLAGTIFYRCR